MTESARPCPPPAEPAGTQALATARAMAEKLAAAAGGSVEGVLLYGSHLLGARPDPHSALDLVVVVSEYRPFYEALHRAGEMHRSVGVLTTLARILPPNVIAYTPGDGEGGIAKCLIVTRNHLLEALSPRLRDHFLLGRLVQRVALVWSPGGEPIRWMEEALLEARRGVLEWVRPYLDEPFDAEGVGRRLLEVCYRGEVRPEARDRAAAIFEAQREHFREVLGPVLEEGARHGAAEGPDASAAGSPGSWPLPRLHRGPDGYRFAEAPVRADRRAWDRHFRRSKLRATFRWFKHMVTFDNWLPYVQRKAERRLGRRIELTRLERRHPLLFLWPRAIRVLLRRPAREELAGPPSGASP